jgi:hypothetical protein
MRSNILQFINSNFSLRPTKFPDKILPYLNKLLPHIHSTVFPIFVQIKSLSH